MTDQEIELKTYADLVVEAKDLKMLRETFCLAQTALNEMWSDKASIHINRLQMLIDELDNYRPLGADGKHGNLHTPKCGCEDK